MTRAYSYIRMSTAEQQLGHSLQRQVEKSVAYAERHGLELLEQDQMHDIGVSAFRGANIVDGVFARFFTAVRANTIPPGSYLLVENLDRLSRQQVPKALSIFLEIINAGIKIVTIDDGTVYSEHNLDERALLISILDMSRSHRESLRKSDMIKAKWEERRKNAKTKPMTGDVAAWLKLNRTTSKFECVEEHAQTVQRIFSESANGIGNYKITKRLNEAKVPSFGSNGWSSSFVAKLLKNRQVLGEYQPCRFC
jgi:DNA invertase Pin-like site-specific DNA recombinase